MNVILVAATSARAGVVPLVRSRATVWPRADARASPQQLLDEGRAGAEAPFAPAQASAARRARRAPQVEHDAYRGRRPAARCAPYERAERGAAQGVYSAGVLVHVVFA